MPLYTSVQGGTGAGTKKAPYHIPKDDWTCKKGHSCRYYWKNCPSCFEPRPDKKGGT